MYDARFARMWEFYLAASEGAFRYGSSNVVQMQLGRERDGVPLHRDYIGPAEAALAAREPEAMSRVAAATAAAFREAAPGAAQASALESTG